MCVCLELLYESLCVVTRNCEVNGYSGGRWCLSRLVS
jgi:hypothetical protein